MGQAASSPSCQSKTQDRTGLKRPRLSAAQSTSTKADSDLTRSTLLISAKHLDTFHRTKVVITASASGHRTICAD